MSDRDEPVCNRPGSRISSDSNNGAARCSSVRTSDRTPAHKVSTRFSEVSSMFERSNTLDSQVTAMRTLSEQHSALHLITMAGVALQTGDGTEMPRKPDRRRSGEMRGAREIIKDIQASQQYGLFMSFVIFLNAIMIGVEQTCRLQKQNVKTFETLENVFLCSFILELVLRFYACGVGCLNDNFVKFDFAIVCIGVVAEWIISPLFGNSDELGPVMVLRTLRLLRLARALRMIIHFRELWMLVGGLLNSGKTMLYTLILLAVMLYIFSCISVELISNHPLAVGPNPDNQFKTIVNDYFQSVPSTMLTLMQFISFDNVVYIYRPLIEKDAKLTVFFVAVIIIMGLSLMNLVTAVIVNSALEQATQDKDMMRAQEEARRKKVLQDMKLLFQRLDEDRSETLAREEIVNISKEDKDMICKLTSIDEPLEIFDALDCDGSGDISIDEFLDGIWQVSISHTPIQMKKVEKQIEHMRKQIDDTILFQHELRDTMQLVLEELRGPKKRDALRAKRTSSAARCSSVRMSDRTSWSERLFSFPNLDLEEESGADDTPFQPSPTIRASRMAPFQPCEAAQKWEDGLAVELQRICTEEVQLTIEEVRRSLLRWGQKLEKQLTSVAARSQPRREDHNNYASADVVPLVAGELLLETAPVDMPRRSLSPFRVHERSSSRSSRAAPTDDDVQFSIGMASLLPEDFKLPADPGGRVRTSPPGAPPRGRAPQSRNLSRSSAGSASPDEERVVLEI